MLCVTVQRYVNHPNGVSQVALDKKYQAFHPNGIAVWLWSLTHYQSEHIADLVLFPTRDQFVGTACHH